MLRLHRLPYYAGVCLLSIVLLGRLSPAFAITPGDIKWADRFGVDRHDPSVFYSLFSFGFFKAELSSDFAAVKNAWLRKHPQATLLPVVTRLNFNERIPGSKLIVVWIIDKDDNLNIELVRRGCVAASNMFVSPDDKLQVPRKDYEQFTKLLMAAEKLAKTEELGIWSWPRPDPNRTDD
jgi:hypothetical protein